MITIKTNPYTLEELQCLLEGVKQTIVITCSKSEFGCPDCKNITLCKQLFNTEDYLTKKIKERTKK